MPVDPSTLKIDIYPTDILRTKADPIDVDDRTRAVARRMIDLMHGAEGIGLAAPQVGLTWRLFVAHVPPNPEDPESDPEHTPPSTCDEPQVFINPEIVESSDDLEPYDEGCLSLPGITGEVRRPSTVTIRATNLDGESFETRATGLLARCYQHELDHLDGVLILDKMSQISRVKNRTRIKALEKNAKRSESSEHDPMNLVFLGSGAFGIPTLQTLAHDHTIRAIVTQPDRKAGRGSKLTPTPIASWAHEHLPSVPILKPENVNDPETRDTIRAYDSSAWVVIAFGQYLGSKLIQDKNAINLHASKLPRWRGAAPINAAIIAGDPETGNSVITIAKEMDSGDILAQSTRPIEDDQTASELHNALSNDGSPLVAQVLEQIRTNTLDPITQDPTLVTLAPKMSKFDSWVDFTRSAKSCARRINGLSPWPCVQVTHNDHQLKLLRATPEPDESEQPPGTIIDPTQGLVATGSGTLPLITVQPPNKKPMDWRDYANGRQIKPNERLIGKADPS